MMARIRINKKIVLALLLLLLAIVAALGWFFNNYEQKEYEIRTDMSSAARYNPLLAADLFLEKIGIEAESYRGRDLLTSLPAAGEALLLYRQSGALTPTQLNDLYNWIKEGGHLVVEPKYTLDSDEKPKGDDLLFRLGVSKRWSEDSGCGCDDEDAKDADEPSSQEGEADKVVVDKPEPAPEDEEEEEDGELVQVKLDGHLLDFRFTDYTYLVSGEREPVFRIPSQENEGDYLLQYQYGKGKITVVTDTYIFSNYSLEDDNYAYLLAWLLKDSRKVWLLYSSEVESIYSLLYRTVPFSLLSLLFFIIFFIWHKQNRIGPLHKEEKEERRNVLAHIKGAGNFYWRLDKGEQLLARVREPLFAYWSRRVVVSDRQGVDWDRIAELAGMSRQEVKTAFEGKVRSEQDMVRVCSCLQKLGDAGRRNKA